MIIAEKIIETKIEGEFETTKKHKFEVKGVDESKLFDFIEDNNLTDDCESAYWTYGICCGFDEEVALIKIDKLLEGLQEFDRFDDFDEEDEKKLKKEFEYWITLLGKYEGYNFCFEENKLGRKDGKL